MDPTRKPPPEVEHRELGEVTALMIRRFATAIGDMNPLHHDDAYARSRGHRGIVAPPTMISSILGWDGGPGEAELLSDGADATLVHPRVRGLRLMGGGQELTFGEPLVAGDLVFAERRFVESYERPASTGMLTIVVTETRYSNKTGDLLVTCRETLLAAP